MGKKPETLFKERIQPILEAIPRSWWLKTQMLSTLGIPDIIGCIRGRFVALELKKSAKDKPSALQQYVLDKIIAAGGYARAVNPENWEEVYERLQWIGSEDR